MLMGACPPRQIARHGPTRQDQLQLLNGKLLIRCCTGNVWNNHGSSVRRRCLLYIWSHLRLKSLDLLPLPLSSTQALGLCSFTNKLIINPKSMPDLNCSLICSHLHLLICMTHVATSSLKDIVYVPKKR